MKLFKKDSRKQYRANGKDFSPFRVKPDINEPIVVDIEWNDGSTQGRVIDISQSGMGLGIKP